MGLDRASKMKPAFLGTILIREKIRVAFHLSVTIFERYVKCVHSVSLTSFHPLLERLWGGADCGSRNRLAISLANPCHYLDKATVCAFPTNPQPAIPE
jgi:hypothetical protein